MRLGSWELKRRESWCHLKYGDTSRMLKIKCTDKIRNEEVFQRMGEKGSLWKSILNRRAQLSRLLMKHERNWICGYYKSNGKTPTTISETDYDRCGMQELWRTEKTAEKVKNGKLLPTEVLPTNLWTDNQRRRTSSLYIFEILFSQYIEFYTKVTITYWKQNSNNIFIWFGSYWLFLNYFI